MCALGARMLLAETGRANSARAAKAWEHPKTVLCPTWVNTQLMEAERNRPAELQNDPAEEMRIKTSPEYQEVEKLVREAVRAGISCQQAADCVFDAIREEKFYILTDPDLVKPLVQMRSE